MIGTTNVFRWVEKPPKIYGAKWEYSATSTVWERTDDAKNFADPVPYVAGATTYGSPFDNILPWCGMVKEERTGGTMVAIPKFYYKLTQLENGGLWAQITTSKIDGYYTSPAHMDRGDGKGERDVVYIGRYHCGASTGKSKTGEVPKVNETRTVARNRIHGYGSNIWQRDRAMTFTIWLLYLVEFADWNSQAKIGYGCGNNTGLKYMGYTNSMPYHTGTTLSTRTTNACSTQYRNIEGLWDNCFDWEDGGYNNNNGYNVILNPANFSDSSGGVSVGTPATGYPTKFRVVSIAGLFPMFIPLEVGGSSTRGSCDMWSFASSTPCISTGGNYSWSDDRGLFELFNTGSATTLGGTGSRIMELP